MMTPRTVRLTGSVLCAMMLQATVSPTFLFGEQSARHHETESEVTLDLLAPDGTIILRQTGALVIERLRAFSPRLLRTENAIAIDSLHKALLQKKNMAKAKQLNFAGERTLALLEALKSRTDSEYRVNMNKLGVKAVRSEVTTNGGQKATRTVYWIQHRPALALTRMAEEGRNIVARISGPAPESTPEECTWYDAEENVTYTGECATQQELDDAAAALVAMNADVNAATANVNSAISTSGGGSLCDAGYHVSEDMTCVLDDAQMFPTLQAPQSVFAFSALGSDAWRGGPSALESSETDVASGAAAAPIPRCMGEGLLFAAAGFNYLEKAGKVYAILFAEPPLAGLAAAVFGGMAAAIGVVSAGLILEKCIYHT